MQSRNPVLTRQPTEHAAADGERMTVNGTIGKTAILLALALITGAWTWFQFSAALPSTIVTGAQNLPPDQLKNALGTAMSAVAPFLWGGLIGGFVLALVTVFKPRWSGITAPVYALAEGFALGAISALMNLRFPGVVMQAVMLTAGVMAVMLVLYRTGVIRVTDKFRKCVMAATGAVMLLYMVNFGLRLFTSIDIPFIHDSGWLGIGFSLFVVGLAAFMLVLDFDMIDQGASQGAPKYMEWYGAFGLMVTLVWLYLEILRLLAKLRR